MPCVMQILMQRGSDSSQNGSLVLGLKGKVHDSRVYALHASTNCFRVPRLASGISSMDKQITQALTSLVPALTGPLPPEMLELSASLLAQSRSKASSLKAEEEIARSYACANIACERWVIARLPYEWILLSVTARLKQSLDLPKIESRPPCPPKVYQKLYKFLDSALPSGPRKGSRPSRSGSTPAGSASKHVRPNKPTHFTNSKRKTDARVATDTVLPTWVMPVVRHVCRKLNAPAAPHHIFAGVSSALSSPNRPVDTNLAALVITLYMLVLTRLAGVEMEPAEYSWRKKLALAAVEEAMADQGERMECDQADIDDYMRHVSRYHWTDMDWFANVDVGSGLHGHEEDQRQNADDDDVDDVDNVNDDEGHIFSRRPKSFISMDLEEKNYLQAGLGTMMDDRVDYLSASRRRSFERWRTEMLLQIDELEAREQAVDIYDS